MTDVDCNKCCACGRTLGKDDFGIITVKGKAEAVCMGCLKAQYFSWAK